jgi:hypothetical protein
MSPTSNKLNMGKSMVAGITIDMKIAFESR